jgi:dynein heavy chain 1
MESLVTSPASTPTGLANTGTSTTFDTSALLQHITNILDVTLGASRSDLERSGSLLSKGKVAETTTRFARFASESQTALYIQKEISSADGFDSGLDDLSSCA